MVTILDNRIRNTVYETIYDLLNADRSNWNATTAPNVIGGHPDINSVTFPIVIINPIEVNEEEFSNDRQTSNKNIVVVVEVYTKGSNSGKDIDNIADGVSSLLSTTLISGVILENINESNGFVSPNDLKIKQKTLTFTYLRR